jgi:hypothetical protein
MWLLLLGVSIDLKKETARISETSAIQPTSIRCHHPETRATLEMNLRESSKSLKQEWKGIIQFGIWRSISHTRSLPSHTPHWLCRLLIADTSLIAGKLIFSILHIIKFVTSLV